MENVDAIVAERNLPGFLRWIDVLRGLGYTSSYRVMDAKDFGVPQHRERCFLVSMKGGRMLDWPEPCPDGRVLRDVMEADVPETYYLSAEKIGSYERHLIRQIEAGRGHGWPPSVPTGIAPTVLTNPTKGSTLTVIVAGSLARYRYDMMNRVYHPEGLAPTILTCQGGGRVPRVEESVEPLRIRYLTEGECWMLQGFSRASFERARSVPTSRTQLYRQAGNSIAVPCLRAIFRAIYKVRSWHLAPSLDAWGAVA